MAEKLSNLYTTIASGRLPMANKSGKGNLQIIQATATVASADNDGDVYRMFTLPSRAVPLFAIIRNTAITGGTDYDLGVFSYSAGGAVLDADILIDGRSMATAGTSLVHLPNAVGDSNKALWELAGLTVDDGRLIDIALTANTVGTADGTIIVELAYAI